MKPSEYSHADTKSKMVKTIPDLTFAKATDYLRRCISTSNIPTQSTCPIDIRLILPSSTSESTVSKVLISKCVITNRSDLPMLILQLQIEINLYFSSTNNSGCGEGTRLISEIEIEMANDQMSGMPALSGCLLTNELTRSAIVEGEGGEALCVTWECRSGLEEGSVGEYWDTYRRWLLKIAGVGIKNPVFRITTVVQMEGGTVGMGGSGSGHHFVRGLEKLIDIETGKNARPRGQRKEEEQGGVEEEAQEQEEDEKDVGKKESQVILRRSIGSRADSARSTEKNTKTDAKSESKYLTQSEKDDEGIDYTLLAKIRDHLKYSSQGAELPFRPSTPELVMMSKIIHYDGVEGNKKPGYNELVEMQAGMKRIGYRGLPVLVAIPAADEETGRKKDDGEPKKINWESYQNLRGNPKMRKAFSLHQKPFLAIRRWTYLDFTDPAYEGPYDEDKSKDVEGTLKAMEDVHINVQMLPYTEVNDIDVLIEGEEYERVPGERREGFDAARGFDPDDDEMFCIGRQAELPTHVEESTFDVVEKMNSGDVKKVKGRRHAAREIALMMNAERFTGVSLGSSSGCPSMMNGNANRPFGFLNQPQNTGSPHLSANAPVYQSPIPMRVMGLPTLAAYQSPGEVAATNANWSTTMTNIGSNLNFPYSLSPVNSTPFNASIPAYQVQGTPSAQTDLQPQPSTSSQSPFQYRGTPVVAFPPLPSYTTGSNASSITTYFTTPHTTSPFTHRYPVRYESPTSTLPSIISNTSFPNSLTGTPNPLLGRNPTPKLPTKPLPQTRNHSPTRKPPLASPTAIASDSRAPDQAYGTSLRLQNNPSASVSNSGSATQRQGLRSLLRGDSQAFTSQRRGVSGRTRI